MLAQEPYGKTFDEVIHMTPYQAKILLSRRNKEGVPEVFAEHVAPKRGKFVPGKVDNLQHVSWGGKGPAPWEPGYVKKKRGVGGHRGLMR